MNMQKTKTVTNNLVQLHRNDLETLIVCAFRYALDRATAMPSEIQRIATQNLHLLSNSTLFQVSSDLRKVVTAKSAGHQQDVTAWLAFAELCDQEIAIQVDKELTNISY